MPWMQIPLHGDHGAQLEGSAEKDASSRVPSRLWLASVVLRSVFILSLMTVIVRVSLPQNETLWTAYDTPGDLVRVILGFAACLWMAVQLFAVPKDPGAFRTWLVLGIAAVPFAWICIFGIW